MLIILVSGKRYAGKDYVCDQALAYLKESYNCIKISHSDINKQLYCEKFGADLKRMLRNREYKESHRNNLIKFAQNLQQSNPLILSEFVFEKIQNMTSSNVDIVFISDFRRKTEQLVFEQRFGQKNVITLRINASDNVRAARGWRYDHIKDTRYTECELDDKMDWNLVFNNDGSPQNVTRWIQNDLFHYCQTIL